MGREADRRRADGQKATGLRSEFQARRQRMLVDKIDVTAFFTWFIENYPSSAQEAKNANEEFWKKFK